MAYNASQAAAFNNNQQASLWVEAYNASQQTANLGTAKKEAYQARKYLKRPPQSGYSDAKAHLKRLNKGGTVLKRLNAL